MKIRRLWIDRFRGVKSLDWTLPMDQRLMVLIGPGDSGKSTVLDALHLLMAERWTYPFNDTDFWNLDTTSPIVIRALLTEIPKELMRDSALGLWLSGVDSSGELHQDPEDGLEAALLIQLSVNGDLEAEWSVVRVDGAQYPLRASARREFSTFRVDDRVDAQLRWSRTSPLGRMSASGGGEREALAAASRAARQALSAHKNESLEQIIQQVQDQTNRIGGGTFQNMQAGLDTSRSSLGASMALHEDLVPLAMYGLGSRRLTSLAAQQLAAGARSIALVDELEAGLEPHRAVRLLRHFLSDNAYSQVFVTTHSPVVVEQAQLANLVTVQKSNDGTVTLNALGASSGRLNRLRRARPSSLLARRVVVTEGSTEYGMLLECVEAWDQSRFANALPPSAGLGTVLQDGQGGSEAAPRARELTRLGIATAALLDNDDRGIDKAVTKAITDGVTVVQWDHGHCLESELCAGLGARGLSLLIKEGEAQRSGAATVRADLIESSSPRPIPSNEVEDWLGDGWSLEEARKVVAAAATDFEWFKTVEGGKALGRWILSHYDQPALARIVRGLEAIKAFVYAEEPPDE